MLFNKGLFNVIKIPKNFIAFLFLFIFITNNKIWAKEKYFDTFVDNTNKFTFDLYRNLDKYDIWNNFVYSPVSIYIAISMAYLGAQSNTQNEISKPFNFPLNYTDLNTSFSKLMDELSKNKQEERNYLLLNTLFLQEGFYFLPSFLDTIKSYYSGVFKELDYTKKYIYKEISNLIYEQTKQQIKDIIKDNDINSYTRLIIANTLYFKANWKYKFNKAKEDLFYLIDGRTVKVKMMYQKNNFRYSENDKVAFLELPSVDEQISMYIVLPKDMSKIEKIEKELNKEELVSLIRSAKKRKLSVYLPYFRFEKTLYLEDILRSKMEIREAFSYSSANFKGITSEKYFHLLNVKQKGVINVNEEGIEVACSTPVIMNIGSTLISAYASWAVVFPAPLELSKDDIFKVDRPFIFIIYHNKVGCILFVGKVLNPTKITTKN